MSSGASDRVREPAARIIQLRRGNPQVKQDALDDAQAGAGQDLRQLVVDRLDQGHPVAEASQGVTRLLDRGRVGVDADEAEARMRGQEGAGMAGAAEGRVDEYGARQARARARAAQAPGRA